MADLVERLYRAHDDDHKKGCAGRTYACSCGYDHDMLMAATEAATEIEALRREVAGLKEYAAEKSNQHISMLRENQELRSTLEPVGNLEMWTESADDDDICIMSIGTIRKMRSAIRALTMSDIPREQLDRREAE